MAATHSFNLRSPAVKRLLQEARELKQDQTSDYTANPLEDNLFEWHFVIRGPEGTEFQGGRYHGRILFPSEYPFKPPNLMLLTPNGRFELNKKICLSITGYHPEYWLPAWGIRTVLLGLIGFLTTKANGAIGGIDYTEAERKILATKSRNWTCPTCGISNIESLPDEIIEKSSSKTDDTILDDSKGDRNMPQFSFVYESDLKKPKPGCSSSISGEEGQSPNKATISVESSQNVSNSLSPGKINESSRDSQTSADSDSRLRHNATIRQHRVRRLSSSTFYLDILIVTLVGIIIAMLAKKLL